MVTVLLVVHAGLLAWIGAHNTPSLDEVGHLVAGVYSWEFGRFDVYRVNPPLIRTLAAWPVFAAGVETDYSQYADAPGARPVWGLARTFVRLNDHGNFELRRFFTHARWALIPLVVLGGYICYRWASDLYGTPAGFMALTLWCISPTILGFGSAICPDAGAAALGVLAAYCFRQWLRDQTWAAALVAGTSLGFALLSKVTWIVLFVVWPILSIVWLGAGGNCPRERTQALSRRLCSRCVQLAAVLSLATITLNLGYGFEGSLKRLADFTFVSRTLARPDSTKDEEQGGNVFRVTWLATLRVPLPENYVTGIDVQKADFEQKRWS